MPGGFADRTALPKGPNGRTLCRWCSLEVPPRRFTFCSDWCVHEWRLRTDAGYLRKQVLKNLRTLCLLCHRQQTLDLRRRLASSGNGPLAVLSGKAGHSA